MRFGVLFFGYLLLFVCKGFELYPDVLPDIISNVIAYALMLYSLLKLEEFNQHFKTARKIIQCLIIVVLFSDIFRIYNYISTVKISGITEILFNIYNIIVMFIFVAYHYFFFKGINDLANDVNIPSISKASKRNFIILITFIILFLVSQVPILGEYNKYIGLSYIIINLIWLILTGIMVFRCYMWICLEGEEDMSVKGRNQRKSNNDKE